MCKKGTIKPIIEKDDEGNTVVYTVVCQECLTEIPVSPMTLEEYRRIVIA